MNNCEKPVATGVGRTGKFCSRSCAASFNNRKPKRSRSKICAGKDCDLLVLSNQLYCSAQCRAANVKPTIRTNTNSINRQYQDLCQCGGPKQKTSSLCQGCKNAAYESTTLGELRGKSVRNAQVYNNLRQRSRSIARKAGLLSGCEICGYSYRVEVAHIIPLASFSDQTTVKEATEVNNFFILCPNHHHEFDDGHISKNYIMALRPGLEPGVNP